MSVTFTTRQGCRITVERVGPSVGVTIHPAGGKPMLYACGADEADAVATMIANAAPQEVADAEERAIREARAQALEEAAATIEADDPHGVGAILWSVWLRARAEKERAR
jgi:hypothetical protein